MAKEYKKISSKRYWFRVAKLWQGKDHLLLSESTGYAEDYKRFYFRDIQAVLMRPHNQRAVWNLVWGLLLAISLMPMATLGAKGAYFFWFCTAFFTLCLVINNVLGPGCQCHLKTAIQTVELPITRRRRVEKIMARLQAPIEAAQQDLSGFRSQAPSSPAGASATDTFQMVPPSTAAKKPFRPHAHWSLYGMLIGGALLEVGRFFTLNFTYYLLDCAVILGVVIPMILALIWQSNSEVPKSLRRVTVGVLFYVSASYFFGVIWGFILGIQHPQMARDQWGLLKWVASQPPDSSTLSSIIVAFHIFFASLLGVIGIIELVRYHQRTKTVVPTS
jgi:hypothetical protein